MPNRLLHKHETLRPLEYASYSAGNYCKCQLFDGRQMMHEATKSGSWGVVIEGDESNSGLSGCRVATDDARRAQVHVHVPTCDTGIEDSAHEPYDFLPTYKICTSTSQQTYPHVTNLKCIRIATLYACICVRSHVRT